MIPPAVHAELTHPSTPEIIQRWMAATPAWLEVRAPTKVIVHGPKGLEREAISLAKELNADLLLADDKAARKTAVALGVQITGTLGILVQAAGRGLLDSGSALDRVRSEGLFLTDELIERTLGSPRGLDSEPHIRRDRDPETER